jgi:hypothetical protein
MARGERRMNMSGRKLAWGVVSLLLVSVMDAQAQARITASAMDSNGNVYVTGWRVRPSIIADIVTIKYDKNGTLLWSHSFPDDPHGPTARAGGSPSIHPETSTSPGTWARPRTSIAC